MLPSDQRQHGVGEGEQEELPPPPSPPPPPLEPVLAVPSPRVSQVRSDGAKLEWGESSMAIPPTDDPRQLEVQQRLTYAVGHELQMAEVPVPGPGAFPDAQLEQARATIIESNWMTVLRDPHASAAVTALRPGRYYAVRARCTAVATPLDAAEGELLVAFPPACSQLLTFRTVPTPPGPMQPPALSQRARNALKLKWALPDETGGEPILDYVLQMQPSPLGWEGAPNSEGFFEVYSGDERSFKVARLAPGVRYTFRIMGFNHLGPSPWSLCSAFSTQASVPAAPEPPAQAGCSADSVTLQWAAPADNGAPVSGYTLEVDDGRGGEFRLAYSGLGTAATVAGLQSGLPYRFRLQAENSEGRSYWSTPTVATTAATSPSAPTALTVMGASRSSVTLAWQPPASSGGSPVVAYEVQLQAVTRAAREVLGDDWLIIYDGPSTATTFSALHPGCTYMARVCARNAAGRGPFTIAAQVVSAPDAPAAPLIPEAEVDSTSLLLKWQAPPHDGGSPLTGYRVEMRCSPSQANRGLDEASIGPQQSLALTPHYLTIYRRAHAGTENLVQVTDLMPGTTYQFRVTAINALGGSPWSPVGSATTLPSVPLAPGAPTVAACSSHSLQLSWREPYGQGAPVTSYTVNMARLPQGSCGGGGGGYSGGGGAGHRHTNGHHKAASSAGSDHGSADLEGDGSCGHSGGGGGGGPDAGPRLRYETVYTGPAASCEVRGLEPATQYALRVRAHNSIGGSAWGECTTVATAAAAPGPPTGLAVSTADPGELHVCWGPPLRDNGATVGSFLLEMAAGARPAAGGGGSKGGGGKAGAAAAWAKVWQGPDTACSVSGLLPGRTYQFRVRASSNQGLGPWCEAAGGTTLPAAPSAPGRPVVGQRAATSLKVRWALPADENGAPVSGYVLQARPAGGGGDAPWHEAYAGVEMAARVAGLEPGTSYELRVAARNRVGLGAWSEAEVAATALRPPPPPTAVAAELDEGPPAALRVMWEAAADPGPAAAEAVGYEVEALAAPGGPSGAAPLRQHVGRVEAAALAGPAPGCAYTVHVRSVGAAGSGHSAWSDGVRVVVPAAAAPAAAASAGEGEGCLDLVAGGAAEENGPAKRKAAKKPKKAANRDPAAAPGAPRRAAVVQQSVAKGAPKKGGWLDIIVPPKWQKTLRKVAWWVAILAASILFLWLAFDTRGARKQLGPAHKARGGGVQLAGIPEGGVPEGGVPQAGMPQAGVPQGILPPRVEPQG